MASGVGGFRGGRVVGDYMIGRKIGSGSYAVVWLGRHRLNGSVVAVKEIVMDRLDMETQDSLLSEIRILKQIKHPNIIALYDIVKVCYRTWCIPLNSATLVFGFCQKIIHENLIEKSVNFSEMSHDLYWDSRWNFPAEWFSPSSI